MRDTGKDKIPTSPRVGWALSLCCRWGSSNAGAPGAGEGRNCSLSCISLLVLNGSFHRGAQTKPLILGRLGTEHPAGLLALCNGPEQNCFPASGQVLLWSPASQLPLQRAELWAGLISGWLRKLRLTRISAFPPSPYPLACVCLCLCLG